MYVRLCVCVFFIFFSGCFFFFRNKNRINRIYRSFLIHIKTKFRFFVTLIKLCENVVLWWQHKTNKKRGEWDTRYIISTPKVLFRHILVVFKSISWNEHTNQRLNSHIYKHYICRVTCGIFIITFLLINSFPLPCWWSFWNCFVLNMTRSSTMEHMNNCSFIQS